jgi:hypothetical protein
MFRKNFGRLYELRDCLTNPESPDSCLKNLESDLNDPDARKEFEPIEFALAQLDDTAWHDIKSRAVQYLTKWDEKFGRGRTQLLDILNEAWGYNCLKKIGCFNISFIPPSKINGIKTPDLKASLNNTTVICEVKTINPSDDESSFRKCGSYLNEDARSPLGKGFFNKLQSDIDYARKQFDAYNDDTNVRNILYFVINFDDFWRESIANYYQQIDQFLSKSFIAGIEIFFHYKDPIFSQMPFMMRYATILKTFNHSNH